MMRLRLILLIAVLLCHLPSAAAAGKVSVRQINGRQYVDFFDLLRLNGAKGSIAGKGHAFSARNFSCSVERDSRKSVINGVKVDLNFPVIYIAGHPYIAGFDWTKSFRPLLFPATCCPHRVITVTIDMGHGGSDPGAMGRFSKEKNITLAIGFRLGQILKYYGYKVHYTRYSDVKIPLERVSSLQRSHRSDIFVSIHVNSTRDKSVRGIETFCLTPGYAPSSGSKKAVLAVHSGNRFDENNLALAYFVQRQLVRRTGAPDRGVKRANFVVLRNLNAPGILVETGFISNADEEKKLNSRGYIDSVAAGIAEGIMYYRRSVNLK